MLNYSDSKRSKVLSLNQIICKKETEIILGTKILFKKKYDQRAPFKYSICYLIYSNHIFSNFSYLFNRFIHNLWLFRIRKYLLYNIIYISKI